MAEKDQSIAISEEARDITYTDIALYVRSCSMNAEQIFSYDLNSLIESENSIVVSSVFDKINEESRIYVFSNQLELISDTSNKGKNKQSSYLISPHSHFKVIGRINYKGKSALLLLHLPKEKWEEFSNDTSIIDVLLVNYGTREFEVQTEKGEDVRPQSSQYLNSKDPIFIPAVIK